MLASPVYKLSSWATDRLEYYYAVALQVRELTDITASKMALLPFYARITATLGQVFSSIADGVVAGLERSFRYYKVRVATAQCKIQCCALESAWVSSLVAAGSQGQ